MTDDVEYLLMYVLVIHLPLLTYLFKSFFKSKLGFVSYD